MDNIVFLKGETIHLRALEEADLTSEYLQWLNDEEVCEFNSHAVFPNTYKKMRAYYDGLHSQNNNIVFAIIHSGTNRHIGNVSLQSINWVSRSGEFAILLGVREFWGKGIAREAMAMIMEYGFKRLNLHRIYCGTFEGNVAMRRLAEKFKMRMEGIRREAMFKNGKYHDIYEFGVTYKEYFSLG